MQEIDFPLVSIITVNFNQSKVTADLLFSLRKISYPNTEVIIVDNGSLKDPVDPLIDVFPEFTFLKSEKNLGFAGGNNLAIIKAKGEFLLFINNDTEVAPGFLEPLVNRFKTNPEVGMVSPKIRFHHTPDTIQYAGYTPMKKITLRQHLIGYREKDTGQYDLARPTFSIHGAAMMVPRSVITHVGMMAELYFLYYEEHDWAERIKRAGYGIYYEPASLVMHKESISTGKDSPLKTYYINRNRFLFARRNLTGIYKPLTLLYLSVVAFPKGFVTTVAHRRFDLTKSIMRAYFWNFVHFGKIRTNQYLEFSNE